MLRDKAIEKGRRKSDSKIIHRITNGKNGKCDKSERSKSTESADRPRTRRYDHRLQKDRERKRKQRQREELFGVNCTFCDMTFSSKCLSRNYWEVDYKSAWLHRGRTGYYFNAYDIIYDINYDITNLVVNHCVWVGWVASTPALDTAHVPSDDEGAELTGITPVRGAPDVGQVPSQILALKTLPHTSRA